MSSTCYSHDACKVIPPALYVRLLSSDGAVPLTEVSSGFTTCLNELRVIIAGHLSTPHNFGGQPIIGGERVHDIVRGLCDAVNSTEDICPPR